jgi:hypothetical protein
MCSYSSDCGIGFSQDQSGAPGRHSLFKQPAAAAVLMVAWDLSMDPIWANFVHGWVRHDGRAWFGVPVSKIYQSFAVYLWHSRLTSVSLPARSWRPAVILYGISAAGNLLVARPAVSTVADASGTVWNVSPSSAGGLAAGKASRRSSQPPVKHIPQFHPHVFTTSLCAVN